jgi:hypothetical protein
MECILHVLFDLQFVNLRQSFFDKFATGMGAANTDWLRKFFVSQKFPRHKDLIRKAFEELERKRNPEKDPTDEETRKDDNVRRSSSRTQGKSKMPPAKESDEEDDDGDEEEDDGDDLPEVSTAKSKRKPTKQKEGEGEEAGNDDVPATSSAAKKKIKRAQPAVPLPPATASKRIHPSPATPATTSSKRSRKQPPVPVPPGKADDDDLLPKRRKTARGPHVIAPLAPPSAAHPSLPKLQLKLKPISCKDLLSAPVPAGREESDDRTPVKTPKLITKKAEKRMKPQDHPVAEPHKSKRRKRNTDIPVQATAPVAPPPTIDEPSTSSGQVTAASAVSAQEQMMQKAMANFMLEQQKLNEQALKEQQERNAKSQEDFMKQMAALISKAPK